MLPVYLRLVCGVLFAGVLLVVAGVGRAESETTMLASWYGPGFEGMPTATGEPYDPYGYTAAHRTLPLGTELVVSYGGSSVEVTVNDRGPYVGGRDLDLSLGAAQALGLTQYGVGYVEYAYAGSSAYQYDAGSAASGQYAAQAGAAYEQYGYSGYAEYGYDDGAPATAAVDYSSFVEDESYVEGASYEPAGYVESGVYVVRSGETLSGIAAGLGVSVEELAASSGVPDPDVIYPGQILYY